MIKSFVLYSCYTFDSWKNCVNEQARVQEFAGGGAQNLKAFFFFFFFFFIFTFSGGGPAQKLAEKKTFSTKKVAKYR